MTNQYRATGTGDRRQALSPIVSAINSEQVIFMSFVMELFAFARARKKFWLLPLLVLLAAFGGLLILAKGSAVAPFIYTIF
jgi:hypothetical protein